MIDPGYLIFLLWKDCSGVRGSLRLAVCGEGRVELSSFTRQCWGTEETLTALTIIWKPGFTASQAKKTFDGSATRWGHSIVLGKSHEYSYPMEWRNQKLRSPTDTTGKWKHLSAVCLPYMPQQLSGTLTVMWKPGFIKRKNSEADSLIHFQKQFTVMCN